VVFFRLGLIAACAAAAPLLSAARFGTIKGTVQVFSNGKWLNANSGMKLETGMPVQTAYNGTALIVFSNGGQMALKPNTKIILQELPVDPGSNREIFLEHGHVSAFVKKGGPAQPNQFRIRTPTITAGVRGSLLDVTQNGDTGMAEAKESNAYLGKGTPSDGVEMLKREMMRMRARVSANERLKTELAKLIKGGERQGFDPKEAEERIKAMEAENKQLKLALAVGTKELVSLDSKALLFKANEEKVQLLLKMQADPQKYGTTAEKIVTQLKELDAEAKKLREELTSGYQNLLGLNEVLGNVLKGEQIIISEADRPKTGDLKQGDTGSGSGDPSDTRRAGARPAMFTNLSMTESERYFASWNDDMKVGIGTDFQQIFNQVNSVTQPTSTGLPSLQKL
jgi:hypothetical protein